MVKVFYSKQKNQVRTTIPLIIAKAMRLNHGDKIDFVFNGKTWEITKQTEDAKEGPRAFAEKREAEYKGR